MGQLLADAFGSEIEPGVLPDDKMYYNIAKRIIGPSLQYNYDLVGDYARDVQTLLNEQAGLSIKGIKPEINQDRIAGIINKISNYKTFDQAKWLLDEPVVNFSQSVVDDTVKANADFQYKAGLKPKIIRTEAGNCCDWCKGLAGVYAYPDVPKDVYRRHRFCRCTVDYYPGDGKKQDVWSKKWKDPDKDDKIRERQVINGVKPRIKIKNSQFGKKANAHMRDFGLDVKNSSDRELFKSKIWDIMVDHEDVVRGIPWRGQDGFLTGYIKGEDVVLINKDGEFVTILKGGVRNARIKNARKR
ncbi:MAG: hypothetical protein E6Z06_08555 [Clostridiales bacterium]|nr:hypothetical protein [Clostridiales bacterium]